MPTPNRCVLASFALALAIAATSPSQGPVVGLWLFDEMSGTTAADSGPFMNDGTLMNFGGTQWGPGQVGNALTFDGIDDYVEFALNGGFPFYSGFGEAFSIGFWVNGSATDDDRVLALSSSSGGTPLLTFGTGRNSNATTMKMQIFRRSDASGEYPQRYTSADVFDATWHHVCYVEHSNFARVFIDGQLDQTFTIDTGARFVTTDIMTAGAIYRPTTSPSTCCQFTGSLDSLQIYAYPLSQADIAVLVAGGLVGTGRAGLASYGNGCGGPASLGPFTLFALGGPSLGGTVDFRVTGGTANGLPVMLFSLGLPAITDLAPLGATVGCTLYTAAGIMVAPIPLDAFGSSIAGFPLTAPNNPVLSGFELTFQVVDFSPLIATNAVLALLGT